VLFVADLLVSPVCATVPAEQQKAIFEQIFTDASKENYFDEDPALKIPEIELLVDMVEKLPVLRTEENRKRLLEAFDKVPVDFEELQEATERLENLKL
jgi:chromosome condensin MukBEF complex kleisin-like MukF subunit